MKQGDIIKLSVGQEPKAASDSDGGSNTEWQKK